MRIALVANRFPVLSETFIYNHAAGLEARGYDVTVVVGSADNDAAMFAQRTGPRFTGATRDLALARGLGQTGRRAARQLLDAPARAMLRAAHAHYGTTPRALRAGLIAMSLAGFDIVHFEYSGLAVAYLDALPLLRPARLVVSCRGTQERIKPLIDDARAQQLRAMFVAVDRVHCVSSDMLRTCAQYGLEPTKAFVNRPAIDVAQFTRTRPYVPRTTGPIRLLASGRLHWAKGLEFGLVAIKKLVDAGHDVHYEIIGAGPEEERLQFAVRDLGLAARVTLAGKRSPAEVRAALEAADIYLLHSVSEGVSNAALEAMAMGLPIVSTAAGGMPEAITHGEDGLLVPSRDPDAMARAIARLLVDPHERATLGAAARRRIEREFSLERQIDTFVAEYEALQARDS